MGYGSEPGFFEGLFKLAGRLDCPPNTIRTKQRLRVMLAIIEASVLFFQVVYEGTHILRGRPLLLRVEPAMQPTHEEYPQHELPERDFNRERRLTIIKLSHLHSERTNGRQQYCNVNTQS